MKTDNNATTPDQQQHEPEPLPRWSFSYAYDVPYYADFCIEARTQDEAQRIADRLLKEGELSTLLDDVAKPCFEGSTGERVFPHECGDPDKEETLHEIAESHGRKVSADYEKWVEEARKEPEQAAKHQVQPNAGPLTPDQQHNALQLLQALVDNAGNARAIVRNIEQARKFLAQVKGEQGK